MASGSLSTEEVIGPNIACSSCSYIYMFCMFSLSKPLFAGMARERRAMAFRVNGGKKEGDDADEGDAVFVAPGA